MRAHALPCAHAYAFEHMCAQACVTAYTHRCTRGFMFTWVCFRAHVRARAISCAHACASAHMCVQACAAACTHLQRRNGIHSCVHACLCFRAHVRAHAVLSAHACASEHMHARVKACIHVRTCGFIFTCVCFRAHVRVSSTCVCFRVHVRASMCSGIHSCAHVHFRLQTHVLPSTCACKHV